MVNNSSFVRILFDIYYLLKLTALEMSYMYIKLIDIFFIFLNIWDNF